MGNRPTRYHQLNPELKATWENSNFTMEEIMDWYNDFKSRYPSGQINMEDFKQIYKEICPACSDPNEFAAFVFRLYDADNSGFLSFREFICGISMTSFHNPKARIDWIFKLYDLDSDGYITPFEMRLVLQSIFKIHPNPTLNLVIKLPLQVDEITPEKITEKMFSKYDFDNDGRLTKEELLQSVEEDPYLAKLLA
ncbi:unnamed protein product [Allacma fusca]|uniref:EF-hand domain-containing protein n=1 Tax=Allacma fusca TaxID=39272 RepID=A0A8J2JNF8_9HEXA|nr:unnamed protein product [Allacma fusca]